MTIDVRGLAPLLQVFDMPASLRFYRDALGFQVVSSSASGDEADWVWLRHGDAHVMLNTRYEREVRPPAPDPARAAAHDDVTLYFGCPDVDGAYAHLQARGVPTEPPNVAPYGMKQLSMRDPDGYGVCFQWPEGREQETGSRDQGG